MIISKVYTKPETYDYSIERKEIPNRLSMESDKETIEKAQELINLFAHIPLDKIKQVLSTTEGQLALSVIETGVTTTNSADLSPLRMLVDEMLEKLDSVQYNKDYITRESLLRELEDVLKAKTITPYRRQRINRALKRECLECLGTGKAGRVLEKTERSMYQPARIRVGVSSNDKDCMTCKGTGIKPRKVEPEEKTTGAGMLDNDF